MPLANLNPKAIIIGPDQASICAGYILFDGSFSLGNSGRSFVYNWNFNSGQFISSNSLFTLTTSSLQPNTTYNVTLTIWNWIGLNDTITKTVKIIAESIPTVAISDKLTLTRDISVTLRASITTSSQCSSTNQSDVTYKWTQVSGQAVTLPSTNNNASILRVPANTLKSGSSYVFRVQASSSALTAASSYALVTLSVATSPLVVIIEGGNRQFKLISGQNTIINATQSYDPDANLIPDPNINYKWNCLRYNNSLTTLSSNCFDDNTMLTYVFNSNQSTLQIPSSAWTTQGALTGTELFIFNLTISKDSRIATSTVSLTPIQTDILNIVLNPSVDSYGFNPKNRLTLIAGLAVDKNKTGDFIVEDFRWIWSSSVNFNLSNKSSLATTTTTNALVFLENVLGYGVTYTFSVNVTEKSSGLTGFASIDVVTATPPRNGYCGLTPTTGYAFNTTFTISCESWQPYYDHYPLFYSFYLVQLDGSPPVLLSDLTPQNQVAVHLPGGNRTILSFIQDRYGLVTPFPFNVTILNDPSSQQQGPGTVVLANNLIDTLLTPSVQQKDSDLTGQSVVLITDLLYNTRTPTATAQELQDRTLVRDTLFNAVLVLNSTSTATSSAENRRNVQLLEQITQQPDELSSTTRSGALDLGQNLVKNLITNPGQENVTQVSVSLLSIVINVGISVNQSVQQGAPRNVGTDYINSVEVSFALISNGLLTGHISGESINASYKNYTIQAVRVDSKSTPPTLGTADSPQVQLPTNLFNGSQFASGAVDITFVYGPNILASLSSNTINQSTSFVQVTIQSSGGVVSINNLGTVHNNFDLSQALDPETVSESSLIAIIIPHQYLPFEGTERTCNYWDNSSSSFRSSGCSLDYTQSGLTYSACKCNHLTSFSISWTSFLPHINTISVADISALTPENVRNHPTTLIGVMLFAAIYFCVLPFAIKRDRREFDAALKQTKYENWNNTVDSPEFTTSLKWSLRQKHLWISVFGRRYGDSFRSVDRLTLLFTILYFDMAINAAFWGKNIGLSSFSASFIVSILAICVEEILRLFFSRSGEEGLRERFERERAKDLAVAQGLEYVEKKKRRLPRWCRLFAFVFSFYIALGCAFVAITYGLKFDLRREPNSSITVTWRGYNSSAFNGPIFRASQDSVQACQLHCFVTEGCNGVVIRKPDGLCYEVGGSLIKAATSYEAYDFQVTGLTQNKKWVLTSFGSALLHIALDAVKIAIIVFLIWYFTSDQQRQRHATTLELVKRKHTSGIQAFPDSGGSLPASPTFPPRGISPRQDTEDQIIMTTADGEGPPGLELGGEDLVPALERGDSEQEVESNDVTIDHTNDADVAADIFEAEYEKDGKSKIPDEDDD